MPRRILSLFIIICTLVIGAVFMSGNFKGHSALYGDALGYYTYLPTTFIYENLQDPLVLPEGITLPDNVSDYIKGMKKVSNEQGEEHALNQYTYGVALMELPFFFAAHVYEKVAGLPANGYSNTYNLAIMLSNLVYLLLGMLLLYKVLCRYFSGIHALLSLVLILLATHLFWFAFRQAGMSHIPLFFLYALLMHLVIKVHERPSYSYFFAVSFVAGFITITRPTDVVCLFIPLLYGVYNKNTFKEKLLFLKEHRAPIALAAFFFSIPFIPQFLYWKVVTGNFLVYSYGGQQFFWASPKIINGLFHFNNGWLPYAPAMIFALVGLLFYKSYKKWIAVILVIMPVYIYIIYSWYCYNYINGLGSRPMIHMYPLLAMPLAAFIQYVSSRAAVFKILFGFLCVFFIAIIFSLSTLRKQNKFKSEDANMPFYVEMLFKNKLTYNALLAYDLSEFQPDAQKLTKIGMLAESDFNTQHNEHYVQDPNDSSGFIYHMWKDQEFSEAFISLKYDEIKLKGAKWVKCSGRFMYPDFPGYFPHIFVFEIIDKDKKTVFWKGCKVDNKIGISDSSCKHANESLMIDHYEYWKWGTVYFYTELPQMKEGYEFKLHLWNFSKEQIFYDDFKIELYK